MQQQEQPDVNIDIDDLSKFESILNDFVNDIKLCFPEHEENIKKLNIDNNPSNTQKYGIRGIPTLLLFKNGEKVDTSVGVLSKSELASFLDKNI